MDTLPTGVTGFYFYKNEPPPQMNLKQYKAVCYQIASLTGGLILRFVEAKEQKIRNYHTAIVKNQEVEYYILCNAHYPLIGFSIQLDNGSFDFIDVGPVAEDFTSTGFTILSAFFLNNSPSQGLYRALNTVELKQINYWKPDKIGNIIFNDWN